MFDQYCAELKTKYNFNVYYKDESLFMKILSYILFFNPSFSTDFTTTIGNSIYFPNRSSVLNDEVNYSIILSHELRHVCQAKKYSSIFFGFLYLFPQILVLLSVLSFLSYYFLFFLVFAAPIPAYFRSFFEKQAYVISLFVTYQYLVQKKYSQDDIDKDLSRMSSFCNSMFTQSSYYFMWPFGVQGFLDEKVKNIKKNDISLIGDDDDFLLFVKESFLKVLD
jgi:hypothetical protein